MRWRRPEHPRVSLADVHAQLQLQRLPVGQLHLRVVTASAVSLRRGCSGICRIAQGICVTLRAAGFAAVAAAGDGGIERQQLN